MRIAKEGVPILGGFALVSAALGWAAVHWLGVAGWAVAAVGAVLTAWCAWFFRDPERATPGDADAVISPADGVVVAIGPAPLPPEVGEGDDAPMLRVCVFMNVFNVHVNRSPMSGTVTKLAYVPGKFFNASLDKASTDNERMIVRLRTDGGATLAFVQIAGLVARRIVCHLGDGQRLRAGERFGLIRFGSRVDVYLPPGSAVGVALGQKTVAGETVLARVPAAGGAPGAREVKPSRETIGAGHGR